MNYCEDCGCKVYNGTCTNCHEEIYIQEQYFDLDMEVPKYIRDKANEQLNEIHKKQLK